MEWNNPTPLGPEEQEYYQRRGYYFPIRVFENSEAAELCLRFLDYWMESTAALTGLPAREYYVVLNETHLLLRWVYRIASHPRVLDAVEHILGPNLIVWSSAWFPKMPEDRRYISWHQDATYWGLHPPSVTTAWIALSESTPENGCLRVMPGSHQGPLLPQIETYARDNVLSRGQEIAVEVDESKAVDLVLQPGEMSLHHIGIVHGSKANYSKKPRIGIAVRYITPDVVQDAPARQMAVLVRGKDEFHHFDLAHPPDDDLISADDKALHLEAQGRLRSNLVPKTSTPST